ncbi:MAG: VanW family protein [Oscillibacter sp.]|jgi:vancomycin resistance protein YoaR|nr:VanW family protein [Oscillibacter sp.]
MENLQTDQTGGKRALPSHRSVAVVCIVLGALLAAYLILCGVAASRKTFYPGYELNGIEIGGLTAAQAQKQLERELPKKTVELVTDDTDAKQPAASITLRELGYTGQGWDGTAQRFLTAQRSAGFLSGGFRFVKALTGSAGGGWEDRLSRSEETFSAAVSALSEKLSRKPVDSAFALKDDTIVITKSKNGVSAEASAVQQALETAVTDPAAGYEADVKLTPAPAKTMTVAEIHKAVAAEMKNAGYDAASGTIIPEQVGAEFDADAARKALDDAQDGQEIEIPAKLEYPRVTAEKLKGVLFRDVLGTARTHVGGTSARINNVKLASRAVNGTVLNSGDIFSYNSTVGKRTKAKGYSEAPAYVQGETVDEVGGGVCQPSSTLYLATLNANLAIVQRSAHRYAPSYIEWGMDATVSWGGPDYQFKNDTDYPIKIVATYSGGYLTMRLLGTKTDATRVKMTKKVLSTTNWKTVTKDDPTLPSGTQKVKVTPYTGYKVESYRNLYDGDGSLLSSKLEAVSNYKVRDKVVLVGTKKVSVPASGSSSGEITEPVPVEPAPAEPEPVEPTPEPEPVPVPDTTPETAA